ncbi:MAG: sugar nucleotide-binding protein [Kofleriaceae bacterium]
MTVLVTGGRGLLGRALARHRDVVAPGKDTLDITRPALVAAALAAPAPALVITAAAYPAVDRAESERAAAFAINHHGAATVARACARHRVRMIQLSTDHVFPGTASDPYRETDATDPVNTYGASKLAGERAVLDAGGTVVRTAWLFGEHGPGFVHAIARAAREQPTVRVVDDQVGCPTYVDDLAQLLLALDVTGIVHACGQPAVTRYAFAVAVLEALAIRAAWSR